MSEARPVSPETRAIEEAIRAIPSGRVSTYGEVARAAGFPRGARRVVRVLHSRSSLSGLPWHRVLAKGPRDGIARIALGGEGFDAQRALLIGEGIPVADDGTVDLHRFGK